MRAEPDKTKNLHQNLKGLLRGILSGFKEPECLLDMDAIETLHELQPEKEIARLGPERYVLLGFHNDLAKDWDARLNLQFWNFAWPYMPSLALVPKTQPPNLAWESTLYSLIEIGLEPAWARRKG